MTPTQKQRVLLFLGLFFGAIGFLLTLLSFGTEYWLLAAESCSRPDDGHGGSGLREGKATAKATDDVKIFHEGLFWRCSFMAVSHEYSIWDLWISKQPLSKVCRTAFLFPFPVNEPVQLLVEKDHLEPYEHHSAIVFRTFWSIFLVVGVAAITIGGFVVICAGPVSHYRLYKVGGGLQLCGGGCLLAVMVMYLMWIQVLDTLEQFTLHQRVSNCPSFHLSVQHGPSFLLAPAAVFFCLLAGLLFVMVGRSIQRAEEEMKDGKPEPSTTDL
ncbi:transmembrane protein 182-like [Mugil cephalus]|uniref:transmembrane protein 182-like n=1 Tax=Mugil cephalus TaxID=48193 RepID=UPI001FB64A9E|nr:transmembrane protein 182-like [Mugil cephalus]